MHKAVVAIIMKICFILIEMISMLFNVESCVYVAFIGLSDWSMQEEL